MDSSMFNYNTFIHMVWIILLDRNEDPGIHSGITPSCYYPRLHWIFSSTIWYITHRSTFVCVRVYVPYFDIDPHCIFWWLQSLLVMESWIHTVSPGGHDLTHCLMHGSVVYLRRLCLLTEHRYDCLEDIVSWSPPPIPTIYYYKVFRPSVTLSDLTLYGAFVIQ